jgi:type III pantothenate kinase
MSVNLLTINVGNTRTQLGVFVSDNLLEQARIAHGDTAALQTAVRDLWSHIASENEPAVYLASVNDKQAVAVEAVVQEITGQPVERMEDDINIPIGRQLDPEALVGEDRLLNAAGAFDKLKQACIVIDAGTAVTVDFVDGTGVFQGGAILPGIRMMLDAMHDKTAQLPQVAFERPAEPMGRNTQQAMRSGVFHGIRGAVRELAEKYAEVYQAYPRIIATGGDAADLFEGYDLIEAIIPELTLLGMAAARRHQLQQ